MTAPIYFKRSLEVIFSRDASARTDLLRSLDLNELFQLDLEESHTWGPGKIAGSATVSIDLGPLTTVRELFVVTDKKIELRINAGPEVFVVKPPKVPIGATERDGILLVDTEFTVLGVENKDTAEANVVIFMAGE